MRIGIIIACVVSLVVLATQWDYVFPTTGELDNTLKQYKNIEKVNIKDYSDYVANVGTQVRP